MIDYEDFLPFFLQLLKLRYITKKHWFDGASWKRKTTLTMRRKEPLKLLSKTPSLYP
jgi:hypothetical protein